GTAIHHLTLYRAASGALVFSAGTVQWVWGVDGHHDQNTGIRTEPDTQFDIRICRDPRAPDPRVEQAMVNLFADMDIQPATLGPHLTPAERSDDHAAPVSRIASAPELLRVGIAAVIHGVADDQGG